MLYTFSALDSRGYNSGGANPNAALILFGGNLYGTTTFGGNGGNGTVFSIETNGTAFATLHNFPTGDPFTVLQHTSQTNSSGAEPLTGWRQPRACRTVRFEVPFPTMLDWSQCPAVERVPGKVSGAWVFKDTRVPVRALFENLEDGATVNDFLAWFPAVTREQVEAVLEHAERSLAVT